MSKTTDMFDGLIGQETLKKRLNFYSKAKKATGTLPFMLFNGAKGLGKTEFAKAFAKSLKKPMVEINCSTIRNAEQFFEQVFIPAILDKDVTILLDECHALPKDLEMAFLTIFNVEGAKTKRFEFGESTLFFEFERQTFLFATTELDKLFPPFKDRLTQLDFEPYSAEQLGGILQRKLDWIKFEGNVLKEICQTVRGNARSAIKRALEISAWAEVNNKSRFGKKEWNNLCDMLGIMPYGINNTELQVMRILKDRGACTLQMLSAVTGMSRTSLQKDSELFLLKSGFMRIDGKREITGKGIKALEKIG
jgi:Holliday junction resolvasome RuvABC ATP-dependent DNA helicase subunit|tara:strand:+ start:1591 stop:2511 length:921 start_codon:yes stop_codon:yes gene_type:complete